MAAALAALGLAGCGGSEIKEKMSAACAKEKVSEESCDCMIGILDDLSSDAQKVFILKELERKSWFDAFKAIGFSDEDARGGERRDEIQDAIRKAGDRVKKECRSK